MITRSMSTRLYALLLIACLFGAADLISGCPCNRRNRGEAIVCVCNATYCDTLELPDQLEPNLFYIYTTSKSGLRFDLTYSSAPDVAMDNDVVVNVDTSNATQEIFGFGGALSDAAGIQIASLSPSAQERFLDSYFGKNGIEHSLMRVPIGGTDFSERAYTYADTDNSDAESIRLESVMHLEKEDLDYKIPYIQRILKRNPNRIRLLSSAWSAPDWMKSPGFDWRMTIDPRHYRNWAEYHRRFFDMYKDHNITFWASTTGNEIATAVLSVSWSMKEHQKWINEHLGPVLEEAGYGDIKLLMLDDITPFIMTWQNLLNDPVTYEYIDGIATHWYVDKWLFMFHGIFKLKFPEKITLSTEASFCRYEPFYKFKSSWYKAESYADHIIDKMNHFCGGWIDWNLALNPEGGPNHLGNLCDAAVIVDGEKDEFYKQPMFYALGHFSKFIPPGSKHVMHSFKPFHWDLAVSAFKVVDSPWDVTVVILNKSEKSRKVRVCVDKEFCGVFEVPPKSVSSAIAHVQ